MTDTTKPVVIDLTAKPSRMIREVALPSHVTKELPEGTTVKVYRVPATSKLNSYYYVQIISARQEHAARSTTILCNCFEGFNKAALGIAGSPKGLCKHAIEVGQMLVNEKKAEKATYPLRRTV